MKAKEHLRIVQTALKLAIKAYIEGYEAGYKDALLSSVSPKDEKG